MTRLIFFFILIFSLMALAVPAVAVPAVAVPAVAVPAVGREKVVFLVEGVEGKNAKTIKEIISKNLTNNYTLNQLQETLSLIYQTGNYSDAEIDIEEKSDRTEVIFKVMPLKIIKNITFKGNSAYSAVDLIGDLGIKEGEGYSADKVKFGIETIKKKYNLGGYLSAQVSGQFTSSSSQELNLEVDIDEGPPCTIQNINFRSVNSKLNDILDNFIKNKKGELFTQGVLADLQNILSTELFDQRYYGSTIQTPEIIYNPLKTKVILSYVVSDPYAYVLVFEGNQDFNEAKLRKELNINLDSRLSNSPVNDMTERLVRFYKKSGYADIQIRTKENLFTQDYVHRVTFQINEGSKIKVNDIHIEGTFSKPEKFYKDFLFDQSGDILYGHVFDAEGFQTGTKNLITELQNEGFISAKLDGTRIDYSKRRDSVTITVVLDEGPQTFVDKVLFPGAKNISNSDLEETIGIKSGSPLQLSAVETSVGRILDLYKSKGYLDMRVSNQGQSIISYSADNTKATLTYDIFEGPQVVVGAILIEGLSFTKEEVVRRELQFHPGEVLTPEKLAYTEQRLQRLSLFSTVNIRTLETDPNQAVRTVQVHVDERDPGLFKTGAGINIDPYLTYKGFAGAAYRNLFGTGRGINARAEVDYKTQFVFWEYQVTMGYTEPFIFDTQNTGRVNLTYARQVYGESPLPPPNVTSVSGPGPYIFAINNVQIDNVIERDLTRNLKMVFEVYGFSHLNFFETTGQTPAAPLDIATVGPTFLLDRRDDPFNPKKGDLTSLAVEFASQYLGSSTTVGYHKEVLGYTRYLPFGKFVFANEVKGGYMGNLSTASNGALPALKAFVLGGQTTLRAFDPVTESIPNFLAITDIIPNIPSIPTETYYGMVKSEIRFPLFWHFGGAIFYDGGMVSFPGYNPYYAWRDDVGVGLHYDTPVGPVNLEYASKLEVDHTANESPGRFLFSIGVF
jgi:outer membrane protein insertion porin family